MALSKLGSLVIVGAENGGYSASLMGALSSKSATIYSYIGGTVADLSAALKLAEEGAIINKVETFSMDDIDMAYAKLANGQLSGRAVILP